MQHIHIAIHFLKLAFDSYRKLWITFIVKVARDSASEWCDDLFLDNLAKRELHGRQIKNAVRIAHALAVSKSESLAAYHLHTSLGMLTQFDAQLEPDFADSPADAPTPMDYPRFRKRARFN